MTDTDDTAAIDDLERIARFAELNPEATVPEALGQLELSPAEWGDDVADALNAEDPRGVLDENRVDAGTTKNAGQESDCTGASTDCADANPGCDARNEDSDSVESGGNDNAVREEHPPDEPLGERDTTDESPASHTDSRTNLCAWEAIDFTDLERGVFPEDLLDREQWMARKAGDKKPWAPWADDDAPVECSHSEHDEPTTCDQCRHSAAFKWGSEGSAEYVHADFDTAREWSEMHPQANGDLTYIQQDATPYAFVDGDDVRDPETEEIHPAFQALLEHLGVTYADISTSGTGVHAYYRGKLPVEGKGQATFDIDTEAWGSNDSPPTVEIYTNKHVCVATGDHVAGTPAEIREWDDDALRAILEAHDYQDKPDVSHDTDRDLPKLDDYEPDATSSDETTTEIRDVLAAVDRLRPRDLPLHSQQSGTDSTGWETWNPSYRTSESGESVHRPTDEAVFHDHKEGESFGLLGLFAAEQNIIRKPWSRLAGEDWWSAVEAAREAGASIPKYESADDDQEYRPDPRDVDVVLEPQRAWTAAARVTPEQLDEPLGLATTDDGEAWLAPDGQRVSDVARAVALDTGLIDDVETPLTGDYAEAYQRAREHHGAPLPEYLTAADAVSRFDYVLGAVRELSFFHLDEDALTAHVTGRGSGVAGDAVRTLDPTPVDGWRDSESGASVLVFESGTVWDADAGDDGTVIDTLRFVALDAGLINDPATRLEGDTFTEAYQIARSEYGAPLPRWNAGEPDVTPVLPPAEELVETPDTIEESDIDDVRDEVETLYRGLAGESDTAHVLRVLPALGKTTSAIKTAADRPSTYLAPRKELMQQAQQKADKHDVSAAHLPILSEESPPEGQVAEAVKYVREHGMSELRNRWKLLEIAEERAQDEDEESGSGTGDDEVHLQRPTCPCGEGDHGEDWALVVHIARELDYTPRDIHERSEALFGTTLPCQEDGECEYTDGWDTITDPDAPIDLLIGHYAHANVEGARVYNERSTQGRVNSTARTLVLDEYPGLTFAEEFGEAVKDHITWLASALDDDVEDFQDLMERDLWSDEFVQAWLDGSADEDGGPAADVVRSLAAREDAHAAVEQAEMFLDEYHDLFEQHGLADALQRLVSGYPDIGAEERGEIAGRLRTTIADVPADAPEFGILQWCDDDVASPLAASASESLSVTAGDVPGGGDLVRLVERAIEAADEREDGALGVLQGAQAALAGGDRGARELAVWADDGYAHREAHYLLEAALSPDDGHGTARIRTEEYTFGADDATLKRAGVGPDGDAATVLLDRDYNGAEVLSPPERHAAGETCPLIGLDATGRRELWELALGEDVTIADVHETELERAEALRNLHDLQVVQTTDLMKSYEGDPDGKNLDADIALLEEIADKFAGVHAARDRDGDNVTLGKPAAITTKVVRQVLEDDAQAADATSAWENYGNLKGSNELGHHQLGALLGCQHYGDRAVERMAAFAGEEIERSGYGSTLDYGGEVANEYLGHMREDQVMQAVLRFARGDSGALVFAHTAALRSDLPVVGEGQVIKSWSPTARQIAEEWRRCPGEEFTLSDVADAVDVGKRQVRRVLNEFAEAGYLERHDPGDGLANEYTPIDQPGAGEAKIEGVTPDVESEPGQDDLEVYYTANVRVPGVNSTATTRPAGSGSTLPAPSENLGMKPES